MFTFSNQRRRRRSTHNARNPLRTTRGRFESLEPRTMWAAMVNSIYSDEIGGTVVTMRGTDEADTLDFRHLNGNPNYLYARVMDSNGVVLAAGVFPTIAIHGVQMSGEGGHDTIMNLTTKQNWIYAEGGNDFVYAMGSRAVIWGGDGNDLIYCFATQDGNQLLGLDGNDTIYSGPGEDNIQGGYGDDALNGGAGADQILGGPGNDALFGNDGPDTMRGGDGNDDLYGGDGADSMKGDDGDDRMWGEAHDDTMRGGHGNDLMEGGWGNDHMYGDTGADEMWGQGGHDYMVGGSNTGYAVDGHLDEADEMYGGSGEDTMFGGRGDDLMKGGSHDDYIYGQHGNDQMFGNAGRDVLSGSIGNDLLDGGYDNAADIIYSGTGDDEFVQHMTRHFWAPGFWVWLPEDDLADRNVALDSVTYEYHWW